MTKLLLLLLVTVLASAPGHAAGDPPSAAPTAPALYRLRPGDLLRLQVLQEPELERDLRVAQDHTLVVPLVGVVNVKDRSLRETELLLTRLYREDFLVNPELSLTIVQYAPRVVNVFGAVNAQGEVALAPERPYALLDIIARAGGFTRLANRTRVSLTRTLPDGTKQNFTINAEQLVAGAEVEREPIQDGDVIHVPERLL